MLLLFIDCTNEKLVNVGWIYLVLAMGKPILHKNFLSFGSAGCEKKL